MCNRKEPNSGDFGDEVLFKHIGFPWLQLSCFEAIVANSSQKIDIRCTSPQKRGNGGSETRGLGFEESFPSVPLSCQHFSSILTVRRFIR